MNDVWLWFAAHWPDVLEVALVIGLGITSIKGVGFWRMVRILKGLVRVLTTAIELAEATQVKESVDNATRGDARNPSAKELLDAILKEQGFLGQGKEEGKP